MNTIDLRTRLLPFKDGKRMIAIIYEVVAMTKLTIIYFLEVCTREQSIVI
jgi:hypothetical protein